MNFTDIGTLVYSRNLRKITHGKWNIAKLRYTLFPCPLFENFSVVYHSSTPTTRCKQVPCTSQSTNICNSRGSLLNPKWLPLKWGVNNHLLMQLESLATRRTCSDCLYKMFISPADLEPGGYLPRSTWYFHLSKRCPQREISTREGKST